MVRLIPLHLCTIATMMLFVITTCLSSSSSTAAVGIATRAMALATSSSSSPQQQQQDDSVMTPVFGSTQLLNTGLEQPAVALDTPPSSSSSVVLVAAITSSLLARLTLIRTTTNSDSAPQPQQEYILSFSSIDAFTAAQAKGGAGAETPSSSTLINITATCAQPLNNSNESSSFVAFIARVNASHGIVACSPIGPLVVFDAVRRAVVAVALTATPPDPSETTTTASAKQSSLQLLQLVPPPAAHVLIAWETATSTTISPVPLSLLPTPDATEPDFQQALLTSQPPPLQATQPLSSSTSSTVAGSVLAVVYGSMVNGAVYVQGIPFMPAGVTATVTATAAAAAAAAGPLIKVCQPTAGTTTTSRSTCGDGGGASSGGGDGAPFAAPLYVSVGSVVGASSSSFSRSLLIATWDGAATFIADLLDASTATSNTDGSSSSMQTVSFAVPPTILNATLRNRHTAPLLLVTPVYADPDPVTAAASVSASPSSSATIVLPVLLIAAFSADPVSTPTTLVQLSVSTIAAAATPTLVESRRTSLSPLLLPPAAGMALCRNLPVPSPNGQDPPDPVPFPVPQTYLTGAFAVTAPITTSTSSPASNGTTSSSNINATLVFATPCVVYAVDARTLTANTSFTTATNVSAVGPSAFFIDMAAMGFLGPISRGDRGSTSKSLASSTMTTEAAASSAVVIIAANSYNLGRSLNDYYQKFYYHLLSVQGANGGNPAASSSPSGSASPLAFPSVAPVSAGGRLIPKPITACGPTQFSVPYTAAGIASTGSSVPPTPALLCTTTALHTLLLLATTDAAPVLVANPATYIPPPLSQTLYANTALLSLPLYASSSSASSFSSIELVAPLVAVPALDGSTAAFSTGLSVGYEWYNFNVQGDLGSALVQQRDFYNSNNERKQRAGVSLDQDGRIRWSSPQLKATNGGRSSSVVFGQYVILLAGDLFVVVNAFTGAIVAQPAIPGECGSYGVVGSSMGIGPVTEISPEDGQFRAGAAHPVAIPRVALFTAGTPCLFALTESLAVVAVDINFGATFGNTVSYDPATRSAFIYFDYVLVCVAVSASSVPVSPSPLSSVSLKERWRKTLPRYIYQVTPISTDPVASASAATGQDASTSEFVLVTMNGVVSGVVIASGVTQWTWYAPPPPPTTDVPQYQKNGFTGNSAVFGSALYTILNSQIIKLSLEASTLAPQRVRWSVPFNVRTYNPRLTVIATPPGNNNNNNNDKNFSSGITVVIVLNEFILGLDGESGQQRYQYVSEASPTNANDNFASAPLPVTSPVGGSGGQRLPYVNVFAVFAATSTLLLVNASTGKAIFRVDATTFVQKDDPRAVTVYDGVLTMTGAGAVLFAILPPLLAQSGSPAQSLQQLQVLQAGDVVVPPLPTMNPKSPTPPVPDQPARPPPPMTAAVGAPPPTFAAFNNSLSLITHATINTSNTTASSTLFLFATVNVTRITTDGGGNNEEGVQVVDAFVVALDPTTLAERWAFNLTTASTSTSATAAAAALLPAAPTILATCPLRNSDKNNTITSLVLVGTAGGDVVALDAATGRLQFLHRHNAINNDSSVASSIQTFLCPPPPPSVAGSSSTSLLSSVVVAVAADVITGLSAADGGAVLWQTVLNNNVTSKALRCMQSAAADDSNHGRLVANVMQAGAEEGKGEAFAVWACPASAITDRAESSAAADTGGVVFVVLNLLPSLNAGAGSRLNTVTSNNITVLDALDTTCTGFSSVANVAASTSADDAASSSVPLFLYRCGGINDVIKAFRPVATTTAVSATVTTVWSAVPAAGGMLGFQVAASSSSALSPVVLLLATAQPKAVTLTAITINASTTTSLSTGTVITSTPVWTYSNTGILGGDNACDGTLAILLPPPVAASAATTFAATTTVLFTVNVPVSDTVAFVGLTGLGEGAPTTRGHGSSGTAADPPAPAPAVTFLAYSGASLSAGQGTLLATATRFSVATTPPQTNQEGGAGSERGSFATFMTAAGGAGAGGGGLYYCVLDLARQVIVALSMSSSSSANSQQRQQPFFTQAAAAALGGSSAGGVLMPPSSLQLIASESSSSSSSSTRPAAALAIPVYGPSAAGTIIVPVVLTTTTTEGHATKKDTDSSTTASSPRVDYGFYATPTGTAAATRFISPVTQRPATVFFDDTKAYICLDSNAERTVLWRTTGLGTATLAAPDTPLRLLHLNPSPAFPNGVVVFVQTGGVGALDAATGAIVVPNIQQFFNTISMAVQASATVVHITTTSSRAETSYYRFDLVRGRLDTVDVSLPSLDYSSSAASFARAYEYNTTLLVSADETMAVLTFYNGVYGVNFSAAIAASGPVGTTQPLQVLRPTHVLARDMITVLPLCADDTARQQGGSGSLSNSGAAVPRTPLAASEEMFVGYDPLSGTAVLMRLSDMAVLLALPGVTTPNGRVSTTPDCKLLAIDDPTFKPENNNNHFTPSARKYDLTLAVPPAVPPTPGTSIPPLWTAPLTPLIAGNLAPANTLFRAQLLPTAGLVLVVGDGFDGCVFMSLHYVTGASVATFSSPVGSGIKACSIQLPVPTQSPQTGGGTGWNTSSASSHTTLTTTTTTAAAVFDTIILSDFVGIGTHGVPAGTYFLSAATGDVLAVHRSMQLNAYTVDSGAFTAPRSYNGLYPYADLCPPFAAAGVLLRQYTTPLIGSGDGWVAMGSTPLPVRPFVLPLNDSNNNPSPQPLAPVSAPQTLPRIPASYQYDPPAFAVQPVDPALVAIFTNTRLPLELWTVPSRNQTRLQALNAYGSNVNAMGAIVIEGPTRPAIASLIIDSTTTTTTTPTPWMLEIRDLQTSKLVLPSPVPIAVSNLSSSATSSAPALVPPSPHFFFKVSVDKPQVALFDFPFSATLVGVAIPDRIDGVSPQSLAQQVTGQTLFSVPRFYAHSPTAYPTEASMLNRKPTPMEQYMTVVNGGQTACFPQKNHTMYCISTGSTNPDAPIVNLAPPPPPPVGTIVFPASTLPTPNAKLLSSPIPTLDGLDMLLLYSDLPSQRFIVVYFEGSSGQTTVAANFSVQVPLTFISADTLLLDYSDRFVALQCPHELFVLDRRTGAQLYYVENVGVVALEQLSNTAAASNIPLPMRMALVDVAAPPTPSATATSYLPSIVLILEGSTSHTIYLAAINVSAAVATPAVPRQTPPPLLPPAWTRVLVANNRVDGLNIGCLAIVPDGPLNANAILVGASHQDRFLIRATPPVLERLEIYDFASGAPVVEKPSLSSSSSSSASPPAAPAHHMALPQMHRYLTPLKVSLGGASSATAPTVVPHLYTCWGQSDGLLLINLTARAVVLVQHFDSTSHFVQERLFVSPAHVPSTAVPPLHILVNLGGAAKILVDSVAFIAPDLLPPPPTLRKRDSASSASTYVSPDTHAYGDSSFSDGGVSPSSLVFGATIVDFFEEEDKYKNSNAANGNNGEKSGNNAGNGDGDDALLVWPEGLVGRYRRSSQSLVWLVDIGISPFSNMEKEQIRRTAFYSAQSGIVVILAKSNVLFGLDAANGTQRYAQALHQDSAVLARVSAKSSTPPATEFTAGLYDATTDTVVVMFSATIAVVSAGTGRHVSGALPATSDSIHLAGQTLLATNDCFIATTRGGSVVCYPVAVAKSLHNNKNNNNNNRSSGDFSTIFAPLWVRAFGLASDGLVVLSAGDYLIVSTDNAVFGLSLLSDGALVFERGGFQTPPQITLYGGTLIVACSELEVSVLDITNIAPPPDTSSAGSASRTSSAGGAERLFLTRDQLLPYYNTLHPSAITWGTLLYPVTPATTPWGAAYFLMGDRIFGLNLLGLAGGGSASSASDISSSLARVVANGTSTIYFSQSALFGVGLVYAPPSSGSAAAPSASPLQASLQSALLSSNGAFFDTATGDTIANYRFPASLSRRDGAPSTRHSGVLALNGGDTTTTMAYFTPFPTAALAGRMLADRSNNINNIHYDDSMTIAVPSAAPTMPAPTGTLPPNLVPSGAPMAVATLPPGVTGAQFSCNAAIINLRKSFDACMQQLVLAVQLLTAPPYTTPSSSTPPCAAVSSNLQMCLSQWQEATPAESCPLANVYLANVAATLKTSTSNDSSVNPNSGFTYCGGGSSTCTPTSGGASSATICQQLDAVIQQGANGVTAVNPAITLPPSLYPAHVGGYTAQPLATQPPAGAVNIRFVCTAPMGFTYLTFLSASEFPARVLQYLRHPQHQLAPPPPGASTNAMPRIVFANITSSGFTFSFASSSDAAASSLYSSSSLRQREGDGSSAASLLSAFYTQNFVANLGTAPARAQMLQALGIVGAAVLADPPTGPVPPPGPPPPGPNNNNSHKNDGGVIAGAIIGTLLLVGILVGITVLMLHRQAAARGLTLRQHVSAVIRSKLARRNQRNHRYTATDLQENELRHMIQEDGQSIAATPTYGGSGGGTFDNTSSSPA